MKEFAPINRSCSYLWVVALILFDKTKNLFDKFQTGCVWRVVLQFKRNPYYQYFCGHSNYIPGMPCNATARVIVSFIVINQCFV
jgi:hypothetical protein